MEDYNERRCRVTGKKNKTQIEIDIHDAKVGKSPNWIVFNAFVGRFDVNRVYQIEFCGSEVHSSIPLKDKESEWLKNALANDFGWGPYDIKTAKKTIGEGINYIIER